MQAHAQTGHSVWVHPGPGPLQLPSCGKWHAHHRIICDALGLTRHA